MLEAMVSPHANYVIQKVLTQLTWPPGRNSQEVGFNWVSGSMGSKNRVPFRCRRTHDGSLAQAIENC